MKRIVFSGVAQEMQLPKPPRDATHAKIEVDANGKTQRAETTVKNFGVAFRGVPGQITWGRYPHGSKGFTPIGEVFQWDGFKVI